MSQLQIPEYSEHQASDANAAADENEKVTSLFPEAGSDEAVDTALDLFNRMSRQITDSYRTLESRVNQLSGELSAESVQRQRELEEKERLADRLTTLLDALPAGVVVLDNRGIVGQCNPAAVALLGEPLEGERWLDIIHRCFAPRQDDGHEVSLKDGRRVSIEIRSMENEPGQLILLTDLTETRQLQAQLSHAQRLTAMGKMVASLAHQIRTPLSAAILYGGHLSRPDLDEAMRERCADRLMSRLTHLEQQVRDMLIFARGETRLAERLSAQELHAALQSAAESLRPREHQAIEWSVPAGVGSMACNRDALVGACMNLVSNSFEAGARQVAVSVTTQDDGMSVTVKDDGPGFSASEKEQILEAFYTTKSHGTGLGLAVVQAVTKAHNGQFDLESPEEGGAQARLTIPLAGGGGDRTGETANQ